MKKILLIFLIVSCSRREIIYNCENQFLNSSELKIDSVIDSFYVEDINIKDTLNFDFTDTETFFRVQGPYIIHDIKNSIEENYKEGVYINFNNKLTTDFLKASNEVYMKDFVFEKLWSLKNKKKYLFQQGKVKKKPLSLRYTKHFLNLKYIFIGYGCLHIPYYKNHRVIFKRIRAPINVIVDIDEIE